MDLEAMRAENVAAWGRDTSLPDYERQVVNSTSRYLPELEAEVGRLRAALEDSARLCGRCGAAMERLATRVDL